MPDRIVRAGILTSDAVNSLSWAAEVFYRRLFSVVDDFGRYDGRPTLLRSQLYPLKIDRVSDSDVGKWLTECVTAGLVRAYQVSGKPYLEVAKFDQRKRADVSKWPDPPSTVGASLSLVSGCPPMSALVVDVDAVVDEVVVDTPIAPKGVVGVVVEAYHSALPNCRRCEVLNPKRSKRILTADKLARALCQQQGWLYDAHTFWEAYFAECQQDAWLRGDVPDPKNPKWKQNIDVLLREDRFAGIMDSVISAMKAAA